MSRLLLTLFLALGMVSHGSSVYAEAAGETLSAEAKLTFFNRQVLPILEQNCFKCHGAGKTESQLDLTSRSGILKGGESGPAVDLEQHSESLLIEAINHESFEMPPTGKLSPRKIATLTKWVKIGLPMPEKIRVSSPRHSSPQVNDETRSHWAFQKLVAPPVPDAASHPIDAFVQARLKQHGLAPNPPAEPERFYRRLHYGLLGLPPTIDQVQTFAAAARKDYNTAVEQAVEELLNSPHYGEHWARYWLDLVRYAESNSFERDNPKPFVWRYRDYVIRSLNEDKPYDQFIREQLAGDELEEVTPDSLIATGFYRLGLWDDEPADPELAFYDGLDDIAATTSQAFLGLSMNCARCHEHKLDPIPLEDYYHFLAFFRNIRHYGKRSDQSVYEASVRTIATPEQQQAFAQQKQAWETAVAKLRAELDAVEQQIRPHLKGGEIDDFKRDSQRLHVIRQHVGELIEREQFQHYQQTRQAWTKLKQNPPRVLPQALVVKENGSEAPVTHVLLRGNPKSKGQVVEPAFPRVLNGQPPRITKPRHGESCGRRRALAEWIASPENPLTARVMVNRIWQWHFGRGIVRTPNNFGLQGKPPTHPELLDWLAVEFMRRGWSIKDLHRLILTSQTYRMSSAINDEAFAQDPVNDLFWRFDLRRLRAEEIRDSILAVNGTLNLEEMYGPSFYPTLPQAVLEGQSRPGQNWHTSPEQQQRRRSIYIHIKRSVQVPILAAFDAPDSDFTCPERFTTTQPTQALGMLNSEFLNQQAEQLSADLKRTAPREMSAQVRLALTKVMQRTPKPSEVERGLQLIRDLQKDHGLSADEARKYFCLVALNMNEFVYLD